MIFNCRRCGYTNTTGSRFNPPPLYRKYECSTLCEGVPTYELYIEKPKPKPINTVNLLVVDINIPTSCDTTEITEIE